MRGHTAFEKFFRISLVDQTETAFTAFLVYSCECEEGELTILEEDVEEDDADLVHDGDVTVQKDGDDESHGVFDLLPLCVRA